MRKIIVSLTIGIITGFFMCKITTSTRVIKEIWTQIDTVRIVDTVKITTTQYSTITAYKCDSVKMSNFQASGVEIKHDYQLNFSPIELTNADKGFSVLIGGTVMGNLNDYGLYIMAGDRITAGLTYYFRSRSIAFNFGYKF